MSGRTWAAQDLVFVEDLGEMTDCVCAPVAQRAGVKSGVCLPVVVVGRVVGAVTSSLAQSSAAVGEINQRQSVIGGVLTEQFAVTRGILA